MENFPHGGLKKRGVYRAEMRVCVRVSPVNPAQPSRPAQTRSKERALERDREREREREHLVTYLPPCRKKTRIKVLITPAIVANI